MIDFNVSGSRFDVSIETIFDSHNSLFSPVRPGSQPHSQDSLFRDELDAGDLGTGL